jgi:glycoside/pentoside/hexuronide:cation symporter, GPH family
LPLKTIAQKGGFWVECGNTIEGSAVNKPASGKLSFASKAGYGLGDLGFLLVWHGSALFLLYFYTDVLGLPPGLAGAIYLISMIWDAVSDPIVAAWAEHRAARTGRYAPIIAMAALPVGLTYGLMFVVPPLSGLALAAWALATHLAFRTAYTIASMPYNTLPVRLTTDGNARSALSGFRVAGAATGAVIAAVLTPVIVQANQAAGQTEAAGYMIAALLLGLLAAALLLACSRLVREPHAMPQTPGNADYLAALTGLFRAASGNTPLLRLLAVMVGGTIAQGLFLQNMLYFLTHVIGRPDLITIVLAASAFAVILAAPVWVVLAARTSKRVSLIAGLAVAATGYAIMAVAPPGGEIVPLIAVIVAGIGGAAIPVMLWSMVPDAIEHGEMETGIRVEARTFGLATFAQKSAVGITAVSIGFILASAGYSGDTAPPEAARSAIRIMVSIAPALLMAGLIGIIWTYPISQLRHQEILAALKLKQK